MALPALSIWKTTFAALPKTNNPVWAVNVANWYFANLIGVETDPSELTSAGFVFTFNTAVFIAQLSALVPVPTGILGATNLATAWELAILASTAVVPSGSFVPPPNPATIFSAVTTTTINTASIAAGKAKIIELAASPVTANPLDSEFPVKMREATLLLAVDVVGLDSTVPTPTPLVVTNAHLF